MPSSLEPTDVGAFVPPLETADVGDDTPTARDVTGAVRVARWVWKHHLLGYGAAVALGLWARVAHPTLTTVDGRSAHDSVQDARLDAHLAYADTAAASSRAERHAFQTSAARLELKMDATEQKVDVLTRLECVRTTPREQQLSGLSCGRLTSSAAGTVSRFAQTDVPEGVP